MPSPAEQAQHKGETLERSYTTRELAVESDGLRLQAIRTRADKGGPLEPHPIVVMIGGIPRNEENNPEFYPLSTNFREYAEQFARQGVDSMVLSPRGMGGSSGDTYEHSVSDRANDNVAAVEHLLSDPSVDPSQIMLLGNSMGGEIALLAVQRLQERGIALPKLMLLSPAAYPPGAEYANFGKTFSEALRSASSEAKLNSPAYEILKRYPGEVFLSWVQGDDPTPVPKEIQDEYNKKVGQKPKHTALGLRNVMHNNVPVTPVGETDIRKQSVDKMLESLSAAGIDPKHYAEKIRIELAEQLGKFAAQ